MSFIKFGQPYILAYDKINNKIHENLVIKSLPFPVFTFENQTKHCVDIKLCNLKSVYI